MAEHRGRRRAARAPVQRGARRSLRPAGAACRKARCPPELPFGHPNFLWPCRGMRPPRRSLAARSTPPTSRARPTAAGGCSPIARRRPRGRATRSKIGRSCAARFPDLAQVDGRAAARRVLRRAARGAACAAPSEEPLAVVLTPGSFNETYFEHAYLARQLGLPLVEGHDLTVRDETRLSEDARGLEARARHPAPAGR